MSAFLNLMATSRFMDDPRRLLIQQLVDADPPMMRITAKQVLDFVSNIDNPSAALLEELRSLRESPAIHEPVVHAVRWIWFATQHCHLFGEQSFFCADYMLLTCDLALWEQVGEKRAK